MASPEGGGGFSGGGFWVSPRAGPGSRPALGDHIDMSVIGGRWSWTGSRGWGNIGLAVAVCLVPLGRSLTAPNHIFSAQ